MTFLRPDALVWLMLIPVYLILHFYGKKRQNFHLYYMTGKRRSGTGIPVPFFMLLSLILIVMALMRPVSNPRNIKVEQKGRNIVFVVDVSRSMMAQDLVPNRLERARFDILNAIEYLEGHRVALIAFAGAPVLKCPLTLDYIYFSQALSELGPHSVSRGGTNLGDAVRAVIDDLFDPEDRESMDILLITDGEDQESFPVESAARAGREGIRIIAIGLGNQSDGSPVPSGKGDEDRILMYEDNPVYSRADLTTLKAMTDKSDGGWVVPVEEGRIPVPSILRRLNQQGEDRNTGTTEKYVYDEHYRWFLIPAVIFTLISILFETSSVFRRRRS